MGLLGVRARFRVQFQAVKVHFFIRFPLGNATAERLEAPPRAISVSKYGQSRSGCSAYCVERPTWTTQAEGITKVLAWQESKHQGTNWCITGVPAVTGYFGVDIPRSLAEQY